MAVVVRSESRAEVLSDTDKERITSSWKLIVPIKDTAADLFYRRLFELEPDYRALFKSDLEAQKRKLMAMLAFVVKTIAWPNSAWQQEVDSQDDLFLVVLALGRRHRELYKIPDEAYDTVREALMWTLDYGLGEAFTTDTRRAWERMYDVVALTMRLGQGATEMGTPMDVG